MIGKMILRRVNKLPPAKERTGPKFGTTVEKMTMITSVVVRIAARFQLKSEMINKERMNQTIIQCAFPSLM